ncbi:MAG: hypothetical protein LBD55_00640 [Treponema sp.]|nr:hypothetical protein [Treponema sp.]
MDSIAAEYRVCKGTACLWVEDTQSEDGTFALPGKKKLKRKPASIHGRCCRKPGKPPPKEPKSVLFRKKKRQTRAIAERNSLQIIDVQEAKGSGHDFKVRHWKRDQ